MQRILGTGSAALALAFVCTTRPAHALVIDIDATVNTFANPVLVSLPAGTYLVTPIGIAGAGAYDAWNPWGAATCGNPSGCAQTIPTTVIGWKNSYDVFSDDLIAVSVSGNPLAPVASEPTGAGLLQDHWIASATETDRYHVDDGMVYPTAPDAFATAETSQFTVSASGLVGFAIRDDVATDNFGGISLEITAIPEPSTGTLVALGLASLGVRRRRART